MNQIGRYALLREVARGGMGVVYRAEDAQGRPVAVKLLRAGAGASEHQRKRFQREVQALLVLRHPHVIELLDAGVEQGFPWLAMEWIEGESLQERLAREGLLDPREAAELVAKLARALAYCHEQGVVHRDLKPDNVLLRADGEPLLTDFGLVGEAGVDDRSRLTQSGAVLGTPGYWAPEQARGELASIGPQSDVWGLGGVLHALLTGEPPLQVENLAELLSALERPPAPPSRSRPGIPRALDAVCRACLALDPACRYPGAAALAEDLERWLAGRRPLAARRSPWAALLVALAALAGLAATVGWLAARSSRPVERASATGAPSAPGGDLGWAARRERAERRLSQRDGRGALEDHLALVGAYPRDAELRVGLAAAWLLCGDLDAARQAAREALELDPRSARAWLGQGVIRARDDDAAGARQALMISLALDPLSYRTWDNLAVWQSDAGDLTGALRSVSVALALNPDASDVLANRGAIHVRGGDLLSAERDLKRALELDPHNSDALANLVAVCAQRGDVQAGLQAAEQAVAIDPRSPVAFLNRGAMRGRMGDQAGAISDYRRSLELDPREPLTWLNLSGALADQGRFAEAEAALSSFLERYPDGRGADDVRRQLERLRAREQAERR